jgi:hypothetical protein
MWKRLLLLLLANRAFRGLSRRRMAWGHRGGRNGWGYRHGMPPRAARQRLFPWARLARWGGVGRRRWGAP